MLSNYLPILIFLVVAAGLAVVLLALGRIGTAGLAAMAIFLVILVVGFVYEWKKGALEWD